MSRWRRAAGPADEALGRSRGGFSTKLHLRAEGGGKPMVLLVTAGQRHEQTAFRPLMERGAVKRRGRGRPRLRPARHDQGRRRQRGHQTPPPRPPSRLSLPAGNGSPPSYRGAQRRRTAGGALAPHRSGQAPAVVGA